MPRFITKPFYTLRDLVNLMNEYEKTRPVEQREQWNRKRVRTILRKFDIIPQGQGERFKAIVSFEQLRSMAPDLVDSMMNLDAYEDAQAA